MHRRPTLVLLPGLDGTGLLLTDFVEALSAVSTVVLIDYPTDVLLGYEQLLQYVKERLPEGDFILIGESFSGPLALMIASQDLAGLKGVVLGASFARLDLPLKSALSFAAGMSPSIIPIFALSSLLLGRWATRKTNRLLKAALSQVSPDVLSHRAREALAIDVLKHGGTIKCPTVFLRAKRDRLIPKKAVGPLTEVCRDLRIKEIEGPHFLFQAAPSECVFAIRDFCDELSRTRSATGE